MQHFYNFFIFKVYLDIKWHHLPTQMNNDPVIKIKETGNILLIVLL